MSQPSILAFGGSLRQASYNSRLVRVAAEAARGAGAKVTTVELRDYPMPMFDEDLEASEGMPDSARRFRKLLIAHDGMLISSPEYNSSLSAALKNAIDWSSRPLPGEPKGPIRAFSGKVAGIMSASPGGLGGLRGLVHLRAILGNIGVLVIPHQVAVSAAHEAFDGDSLKDEATHEKVARIGADLADMLARLSG